MLFNNARALREDSRVKHRHGYHSLPPSTNNRERNLERKKERGERKEARKEERKKCGEGERERGRRVNIFERKKWMMRKGGRKKE